MTRFYRWHIDAALYKLSPPKVTTLYAVKVPEGEQQTLRYDDGSGDEIKLPRGSTVCEYIPQLHWAVVQADTPVACGENTFNILPPPLKSLAVRTKVRYAPHPYVWMAGAKAQSTGLGLESDGTEIPLSELPDWTEDNVKVLPMLWKNPVTGRLALQVHPCAAMALEIAPLPEGAEREGALFPDGGKVTDLKEVRELLKTIQRPGIDPKFVFCADWREGDLVLFHNRGLLHSVTGALRDDELRMFHQCNLAASSDPVGPTEEDVKQYA